MNDVLHHVLPVYAKIVRNIHFYLHVNMLLEIMHTNAMQVMLHLLEPPAQYSNSILNWPYQLAWQVWKTTIHQLYAKEKTDMLAQSLSQWIPDSAQLNWQWN